MFTQILKYLISVSTTGTYREHPLNLKNLSKVYGVGFKVNIEPGTACPPLIEAECAKIGWSVLYQAMPETYIAGGLMKTSAPNIVCGPSECFGTASSDSTSPDEARFGVLQRPSS